jgi:hypothetical protein
MSRGRRIASVAIVLSMGAFDSLARGEAGLNTLRGIDKIKVVIEDLNTDSTNYGVTESGLQAQAEHALRQVGIVTDSNATIPDSLSVPVLYVSLSADRADGFHTFLIRLDFLQAVTLARDPAITASSVTTWSTVRFGRVDEHGYAGRIRILLTIMLQKFQDDFLAVNPSGWPPRNHVQTTSAAAVSESPQRVK